MKKQDQIKDDSGLLPDLDDFSTASIKRAVRNESFLHPFTLYPAAIGVLSGMAAAIYDFPLLFLGMGGFLAVSATTSVINFFFREDSISSNYLTKLSGEFKKRREVLLKTLKSDLQHCATIKGAEQYGRQGKEQFLRVAQKYNQLKELLETKFSTSELTYGSYLGAAEQVYLSVLDNLLKIVSLLKSIETIDIAYIETRNQELEGLNEVTSADEREFETLRKRLELREVQLQQVNTQLTENEESMTIIDETVAAIGGLQTGQGLAENDLQTAMTHLKEIASRTKHYK